MLFLLQVKMVFKHLDVLLRRIAVLFFWIRYQACVLVDHDPLLKTGVIITAKKKLIAEILLLAQVV